VEQDFSSSSFVLVLELRAFDFDFEDDGFLCVFAPYALCLKFQLPEVK